MRAFDVELEWGAGGVEALAGCVDHLVLIDVLSFTTCVDVALEQGASVLPWRWHNPTAEAYARERGARLAQRREAAGEGGLSLSPGSLRTLQAGEAVVLPSPNGATLSVLARGHPSVWAGCLRNASALARELAAGRVAEDALPRDILMVLARGGDTLHMTPDEVMKEAAFFFSST